MLPTIFCTKFWSPQVLPGEFFPPWFPIIVGSFNWKRAQEFFRWKLPVPLPRSTQRPCMRILTAISVPFFLRESVSTTLLDPRGEHIFYRVNFSTSGNVPPLPYPNFSGITGWDPNAVPSPRWNIFHPWGDAQPHYPGVSPDLAVC